MTSTLDYTVSGGYIQLPVTTDPSTLQQDALTAIATELPGWSPVEGHIEVLLLEQFAAMVAESAQVAASVPLAIFSYFGTLVGITPIQGANATALTTWTMVDNKGYTVPGGTSVGYQVLGNQIYYFTTVDTFTVPAGDTQTAPGAVTIQAQSVGTAYNGLVPQHLTLVTAYAFVSDIASTTVSSGGADQETTTAYLNRLSDELQLLTPRPILPADFAALAQSVAGVYRAVAFNGLNPYANILTDEDTEHSVGIGTATATQNCTIALESGTYGEEVIRVTAGNAGTDAIFGLQNYSVAQLTQYTALMIFDVASTARDVAVKAQCYDVNGDPLGTPFASTAIEDSTTKLTFVVCNFETPAHTFKVGLSADITTPANTETHQVAFASLLPTSAPTNFVPDSALDELAAAFTWYGGTGGATTSPPAGVTITPFMTDENGFVYEGTGSASSTQAMTCQRFELPVGEYTMSAFIDATNVSSGTPKIEVTNDSATVLASITQTAGDQGTISATFTLGSATTVQFTMLTDNCTVTTGLPLTFARPNIAAGGTIGTYAIGPTYGAADLVTDNERMVTVGAVDVDGDALVPSVMAAISAYLEAQRETNFIVNVIGPSYTTIDVTWSGVATATANPADVQTAANTALQSYLSPADWAGGDQTPPYWDASQTVVRYLSVVTLLGETPGMDFLTSVTIGYHGATLGTDDVDLVGYAPLPQAGTIAGTVVAN